MEKIRTSKCSRIAFWDLVSPLSRGVNNLEPLGVEVAILRVGLKLLQKSEKPSGGLLWKSSSVEGLGECSTVGNFLVIMSISDCDLFFDYSF